MLKSLWEKINILLCGQAAFSIYLRERFQLMTELLLNHVFGCWELPQTWNPIDNRLHVADEITKSTYIISEVNETSKGNLLNGLKTFYTSPLETSEKWNISQYLAECSNIMLVKGFNCSKTNSPTALPLLGWRRTSWVLNVLMDSTHGIVWGFWTELETHICNK